jgi:hypothetical protein
MLGLQPREIRRCVAKAIGTARVTDDEQSDRIDEDDANQARTEGEVEEDEAEKDESDCREETEEEEEKESKADVVEKPNIKSEPVNRGECVTMLISAGGLV